MDRVIEGNANATSLRAFPRRFRNNWWLAVRGLGQDDPLGSHLQIAAAVLVIRIPTGAVAP